MSINTREAVLGGVAITAIAAGGAYIVKDQMHDTGSAEAITITKDTTATGEKPAAKPTANPITSATPTATAYPAPAPTATANPVPANPNLMNLCIPANSPNVVAANTPLGQQIKSCYDAVCAAMQAPTQTNGVEPIQVTEDAAKNPVFDVFCRDGKHNGSTIENPNKKTINTSTHGNYFTWLYPNEVGGQKLTYGIFAHPNNHAPALQALPFESTTGLPSYVKRCTTNNMFNKTADCNWLRVSNASLAYGTQQLGLSYSAATPAPVKPTTTHSYVAPQTPCGDVCLTLRNLNGRLVLVEAKTSELEGRADQNDKRDDAQDTAIDALRAPVVDDKIDPSKERRRIATE